MLYSERIKRREALWWGPPRPGGRTLRDALHRVTERRALRSREDPDEVWRCCPSWPRTLLTKPNSREFAARHGLAVAPLLWQGTDAAAAPLEELDDFCVKPFTGSARKGIVLVSGGVDILRDKPATPDVVRAAWPRGRRTLIEARVRPHEPGRPLPVELKVHTFAGRVVLIDRTNRIPCQKSRRRYYTPEWEPLSDRGDVVLPQDEVVDPPAELAELLDATARMSATIGTYMRIDVFHAEDGLVFNEVAATPLGGDYFTPYVDELLGRLWAEHLGDAV